MSRRRLYAEPEPRRDEEEELEPEPAETPPQSELSPRDTLHQLQRSAGNAATGRLLRSTLARDPAAPPAFSPFAPKPVDVWAAAKNAYPLKEYNGLDQIVPPLLQRLKAPPLVGIRESLAEVTLLVRNELQKHLEKTRLPTDPQAIINLTIEELQARVVKIAAEQNIIIPGHRRTDDTGDLEKEARALADLAGIKLDKNGISATAAGLTFRFNGDLTVAGKVGGVPVQGKAGSEGAEAKVGPVHGSVDKTGKVKIDFDTGPVVFSGHIHALPDGKTTWSIDLAVKFGNGAIVPDPAVLASMLEATSKNVTTAAEYVGSVVAGKTVPDQATVEAKLKPVAESAGRVTSYIEKHQAKPSQPGKGGATLGVSGGTDDKGITSVMLKLTITFD